jgi:pimeloyl-ACP methyl ester carboxylesterase
VTSGIGRRAVVGGLAAIAVRCSRQETASRGVPATLEREEDARAVTERRLLLEKSLEFAAGPAGAEKALALIPGWATDKERFPVLVALHGRGEAVRGADVGARAWMVDYDLGRAVSRLRAPPLEKRDFQGFVTDERLAQINHALAETPFGGLIVVCPWVPDLLSEKDRGNLEAARPFGRFLLEQLVPRVMAETPAQNEPAAVGIDGVSLGGRVALLVGLQYPERFAALGTLQAAIQEAEVPALAQRARDALTEAGAMRLRLLTSREDYFVGPITSLHQALSAERVPHDFVVAVGPHDYAFNRGPGGIEMLLWHDRVLRGKAPV